MSRRNNMLRIWEVRMEKSLVRISMARQMLDETGHEFYRNDVRYWESMDELNRKFQIK